MNLAQAKKSQKSFSAIAERTEISSVDGGGWCLSVTWRDGGSKIYYSYDDVLEKLQMQVKTWYVIRTGWNSANQSSVGAKRNPTNDFESKRYMLVGIVDAVDAAEAIEIVGASCYNNQQFIAVDGVWKVKGLTQAVRDFRADASVI
jgi:hypothetical protein